MSLIERRAHGNPASRPLQISREPLHGLRIDDAGTVRMPCWWTSVAVAQQVRAPGCGPGGRGFKSPRSPQNFLQDRSCVGTLGDLGTPTVAASGSRKARGRVIDFHGASSSTAEQRTLNPQVSGSNPEGRTRSEQARRTRDECPNRRYERHPGEAV